MNRSGGARGLGVAVALGALMIGIAGCGSPSGQPHSEGASSRETITATVTPPATPTNSSKAATPAPAKVATPAPAKKPAVVLPAGYRWRTVQKVHTAFAAPKTWTAMDAAKLSSAAADSPAFKELEARTGYSAQQLSQFLAHVDLFLAGPPVRGYAPNIQAVVLPVLEMPSDEAIRTEIAGVASATPTLRHAKTSLGNAVDVSYRIKVAGRTAYVHSLLIDSRDGVLDLTVAAPSEAMGSSLTRTLLKTVHRV